MVLTRTSLDTDIILTRSEFKIWVADDLAKMTDRVAAALTDADVATGDIDHVFLTGGTSQTPAVQNIFAELLG